MTSVANAFGRLVLLCGLALALLAPLCGAQAKDGFAVLHSFCSRPNCSDGYYPQASLIADDQGNLYGTTYGDGGYNNGIVFKLAPDGKETVLHSFCSEPSCSDGNSPSASLIADNQGNLYGTTYIGGTHNGGTVFKLAPDGTETVLHSFCSEQSCADGFGPTASLIADNLGNLYGTTYAGGKYDTGIVFKLTPDGTETVLHSFTDGKDGASPHASLIADAQGNLYGTTLQGGKHNGGGNVFKLAPDGRMTVLHSFCSKPNCTDGENSYTSLIADAQGNLYGTTYKGGKHESGTVFKLTPDGKETVLHSFAGGRDGYSPLAGLIADAQGNLYGTTDGDGGLNNGTVFRLAPDGKETVLHSFCSKPNCSDGEYPQASLIADGQGNIYGTTMGGGKYNYGTVFKLAE